MAEVFLKNQIHRNIEARSKVQLEELLRIAKLELDNYLKYVGNKPRPEHLRSLNGRIKLVQKYLDKSTTEQKELFNGKGE